MEANQRNLFLFIGITVLIGCFIYLKYIVKKVKKSQSSVYWPKVIATVSDKFIDSYHSGSGFRVYSPKITYNYTVGNIKYSSDLFTLLGTSGFTNKFAKGWVDKFNLGDEVEISYNPNDPNESVIVPGVHWGQYIEIAVIFLVFFILALANLYIFFTA